jgi:hypothetical protein
MAAASHDVPTPTRPDSPGRARRRAIGLGAAFAATLALLVGWAWRHREALRREAGRPPTYDAVLAQLDVLEQRAIRVPRVAVLGDSLLGCGKVDVPGYVAMALQAAGKPVELVRADAGGFRPLQYYYVLDEVIATRPSLAIVEVNLGSLAIERILRQIRYLTLSRRLSFVDALRVRDALAIDDLTVFDPWLYRLEARWDLLYVSDGVRAWSEKRLADAGWRVNAALGLRVSKLNLRATRLMMNAATSTRGAYDVDQTRLPMTGVLREVHRRLRRAGIDVQFWIPPIDVERLAESGAADALELRERIERLRVAVGATAEEWLDLHALHQRTVFVDWAGHTKPEGCQRVAGELFRTLQARALPRPGDAGAQNWK